ncbi:MAG: hypothetical protein MUC49_18670 [Raineya sp.]|jgi:hypothetical protein|nr:hypothetical protein [Raineya sp.]
MKNKIIHFGFALIFSSFLAGCGKDESKNTDKKDSTSTEKTTQKVDSSTSTPKTEEKTTKSTLDLLQGKWQSIDDSRSFVVFENNLRKDIYDGEKSIEDEVFVLSDECQNPLDKKVNKEKKLPKEKDKYISCAKSDMCWYILELDDKTLSLSYMSRGNTLTYKKVEKK